MTRRLLMIGNSHVIALRDAFDAAPQRWPGIEIAYLGFRGSAAAETRLKNGAICAASDETRDQMEKLNGTATFDVSGYDGYVLVGLGFKPLHTLTLARHARWPFLHSLFKTDDLAGMEQTMISRPAARAGLTARLARSGAGHLARLLRRITDAPVLMVPQPWLNQKARWSRVPRFYGNGRAIRDGDAPELARLFTEAARAAARRIGVDYLPQPRRTMVDDILTRQRFMLDKEIRVSTRNGAQSTPDVTHANPAFGALVLNQINARLAP